MWSGGLSNEILQYQAFSGEAQCFIDQYENYTVPELIDILGEVDAHVSKSK